jgi:hypothetical protein
MIIKFTVRRYNNNTRAQFLNLIINKLEIIKIMGTNIPRECEINKKKGKGDIIGNTVYLI